MAGRRPFRTRAVLVVGMHRSGTSALTRVISLLGADLPSRLMPANEGINDTGFWESDDIYRLHEQMLASAGSAWDDVSPLRHAWFDSDAAAMFRGRMLAVLRRDFEGSSLLVLKDPRFCRLLPFWTTVLQEFGAEPLCALMLRNPLEVAASLKRTHGLQTSRSLLLWLRHVLDSERDSRNLKRCFVTYDQLLRDWRLVARAMTRAFALEWPRRSHTATAHIESFLSERYRHHTCADARLEGRSDVIGWVRHAYAAVSVSEHGDDGIRGRLDRLRNQVDVADQAFGPLIAEGALRGNAHMAEAARLAEELQGVRAKLAASENALGERDGRIASLKQAVARRDAETRELGAKLEAQQARARACDEQITSLSQVVAQRDAEASELGAKLEAQRAEAGELSRELEAQRAGAGELSRELEAQRAGARELSRELEAQQARARSLEGQLSAVYTSRSWRITAPLRAIKTRLLRTPAHRRGA
jgi:hypothetical protein